MNLDVRTKKTIEEGIQIREERGDSTFLLYAPENGTIYLVVIQKIGGCSPKMKDRMGLGIDDGGWLVTYMGSVSTSMVVIDDPGGLLHWEYVRRKLHVGAADAVVLAELVGFVTGRAYIPSEEFLEEAQKPRPIPCCDRHPGSEAPNR
jgi:hypothetical protein